MRSKAQSSDTYHAKKRRLLEVAVKLFSEKGYRATSIPDLAEAAELGRSSLYYYMKGKEELLVEIYREVLAQTVQEVRAILGRGLSTPEALREIVVNRVVYTCENRALVRVFFEEELELPPPLALELTGAQREYQDLLTDLLERGRQEGSLSFGSSAGIAVNTLLGAVNWSYRWYRPDGALSPQALGEQIAGLLLGGLHPSPLLRNPSGTRAEG